MNNINTPVKTPVHEILHRVLADDDTDRWHISKFPGKTHYLGKSSQELKAAYPKNYFPRISGSNIIKGSQLLKMKK